jgi:preprotein translocase subunit SecG
MSNNEPNLIENNIVLQPLDIETPHFNYEEINQEQLPYDNLVLKYIHKNYDYLYQKFFHIYFIIVFEIMFYFNYIVNIEAEEVEKILKNFANYLINLGLDFSILLPPNERHRISFFCNSIEENLVSKNNVKLENEATRIIWILSIIWVVLTLFHFYRYRSIKKIGINLLKAIIFIGLIGIFEFYFFNNIVKKYVTLGNEEATCYLFDDLLV